MQSTKNEPPASEPHTPFSVEAIFPNSHPKQHNTPSITISPSNQCEHHELIAGPPANNCNRAPKRSQNRNRLLLSLFGRNPKDN
ncbi:hypothetical protein NC652_028753 [Populus alba x Populus x berolinensis]|nr:hypothetical protein NC652_028753 [Populus alba x Populus x berolinensis]